MIKDFLNSLRLLVGLLIPDDAKTTGKHFEPTSIVHVDRKEWQWGFRIIALDPIDDYSGHQWPYLKQAENQARVLGVRNPGKIIAVTTHTDFVSFWDGAQRLTIEEVFERRGSTSVNLTGKKFDSGLVGQCV